MRPNVSHACILAAAILVGTASQAHATPPNCVLPDLIRTLDDNADELHGDYTPSVHALAECGWPAARAMLELLDSPSVDTRMHAQRVLEGVVLRAHGWRPGQGYVPGKSNEDADRALLLKHGYDFAKPPADRQRAIALWRAWLVNPR